MATCHVNLIDALAILDFIERFKNSSQNCPSFMKFATDYPNKSLKSYHMDFRKFWIFKTVCYSLSNLVANTLLSCLAPSTLQLYFIECIKCVILFIYFLIEILNSSKYGKETTVLLIGPSLDVRSAQLSSPAADTCSSASLCSASANMPMPILCKL